MVVNTLDGSPFFRFIFILRLFFFQCQGSNPVLVHAGRVIYADLHPQTHFSSLLASPEMAPASLLCRASPPISNPSQTSGFYRTPVRCT